MEDLLDRIKFYRSVSFEDLEKMVDFNDGLPTELKEPPWRVPATNFKAAVINRILDQSFRVQASVIPTEKHFFYLRHRVLDAQCNIVTILLRRYLKYLGVEAKVICGMLLQRIPHVFLEIESSIIDNQYVCNSANQDHIMNRKQFIEQMLEVRQLSSYSKVPPSQTKYESFEEEWKQDGDDRQFGRDLLELGTTTEHEQNKTVAFTIATAAIDPGCLIYDKLMRGWIKKSFNVAIPSLEEEMRKICWFCEKKAEYLKKCGGCGVAIYCGSSTECQIKDWKKIHKKLHSFGKNVANNRMKIRFGICNISLRTFNP